MKLPPRVLKIKPLSSRPVFSQNLCDRKWKVLREAVLAIQLQKSIGYHREDLYAHVESLCMENKSQFLYENLFKMLEDRMIFICTSLTKYSRNEIQFLQVLNEHWKSICSELATLQSIFLYLDRTYIMVHTDVRSIWDLGLYLFRKVLFSHTVLENKIISGLNSVILQAREGEMIDAQSFRDIIRMISSIGMYKQKFEPSFLNRTRKTYATESLQKLETLTIPKYLQYTVDRIREENERMKDYIDTESHKCLIQCMEHTLLRSHVDVILERGFRILMQQNDTNGLTLLYKLFNRSNVEGLSSMKVSFFDHVKSLCSEILKADEKVKINSLLDFQSRFSTMIQCCFAGDKEFARELTRALKLCLNLRSNDSAEFLAKFIDKQMKSGGTRANGVAQSPDSTLNAVMSLFRLIQGKDIFEAFYKNDLAKRLLLNTTASLERETVMIAKLKSECGGNFTGKLEGMLKDVDISKELYNEYLRGASQKNIIAPPSTKLLVHVITTGFWPAYSSDVTKIPNELGSSLKDFQDFYIEKFHGRKLTWITSLGRCILRADISASMPKNIKEFEVSMHQAIVLLLFNKKIWGTKLSFDDISEATGIPIEQLKQTLQSLSRGKFHILNKFPKCKVIETTDTFSINDHFKHQKRRIKINQIQYRESRNENEDTTLRVHQDRQYQVDACIVRIMKARKMLSHNSLIGELMKQLKFPVTPSGVKKRVESLLDREYIERDDEDNSVYVYVA